MHQTTRSLTAWGLGAVVTLGPWAGAALAQLPTPSGAPASKAQGPFSPIPPKPEPPNLPPPEDGGLKAFHYSTDEAIEFYQRRVAAVPKDYISLRVLGELHERKARETGNLAEYARAEEILRKAVALNPDVARARASLAAVLCSRHKFAEGLEIARALVKQYPDDIDAASTMGDALLELGRYEEAESTYKTLAQLAPFPEVFARQANLAEIRGDVDGAVALMRRAIEGVKKNNGPEDAAWFQARLGDMLFDAGKVDEAEALYRVVPAGVDALHDATFGLAKVLIARGKLKEALAQTEKALAIGPDLHMLAALADLQTKLGDKPGAEATVRRLDAEALKQAEHSRDVVYFNADHDRDLPRALELAKKEIAQRADVFTQDALAWALFKNGKLEEAAQAIDKVLAVGTKDARIRFHAGMIHAARGDRARARDLLKQALATNPHFSILGPDQARARLAELGEK
ncbi:MAG: tetratricopeptide repeat protein [Isosphaeraceae bacterium]